MTLYFGRATKLLDAVFGDIDLFQTKRGEAQLEKQVEEAVHHSIRLFYGYLFCHKVPKNGTKYT